MDNNEQQHETSIVIGFTLIDFACALTYIGLAIAMTILYGFTAGLLALAAGGIVGYAASGIAYRTAMRASGQIMEALAKEATKLLNLATKEIKDLRSQLNDAQAK